MIKRSAITLMICCSTVLAGCSGSEKVKLLDASAGNDVTSGTESGGNQNGGVSDGSTNTNTDTDANTNQPCPSGSRCTAPAGEFVCTEATTGTPPPCVNQTDCSYGTCTQYQGTGFCTLPCGPAVVDECPTGSMCSSIFDGAFVCEQVLLEGSPLCESQADCPFGKCIRSYNSQNYCIQPCRPPTCTNGTACAPFWGKFYCAQPSTGLPDSCSTLDDTCQYGMCVDLEDTSFCTQECQPKLVEPCPSETICRAIAPYGFLCSDPATAIPPVCQSQADCTFGTCIKSGDISYCTEYCSQPTIDVTGTIFGLDSAVEGVEVCIFEDGSANSDYCATTDSNGLFTLYELPESGYFILSMTKVGYQSNLQLAIANVPTSSVMYREEEISAAASALGLTYSTSGTGLIVFAALDGEGMPVSGYTAAITPQAGLGPFYADSDSFLDQSLTASSTTGWGAYFNLDPGNYTLGFTKASADCEDLPEVFVVSGFLTYVLTGCF